MKDFFIGIDPGEKGAWCLLEKEKELLDFGFFTNFYDISARFEAWDFKEKKNAFAVLEDVKFINGWNAKTANSLLPNRGGWEATLACHGVPCELAKPKEWQKLVKGSPSRPIRKPGATESQRTSQLNRYKREHKAYIAKYAMRLEPRLAEPLKLVKHYDLADAYMMARYAIERG